MITAVNVAGDALVTSLTVPPATTEASHEEETIKDGVTA
jgi:hypothetical protein